MADERQGDEGKPEERTVETSEEHTVELDRGVPEPDAYPYLGDLDAGLPATSRQRPAATTSPGTPAAPPGGTEHRAIAIAVGAVLLLLLVAVVGVACAPVYLVVLRLASRPAWDDMLLIVRRILVPARFHKPTPPAASPVGT